MIGRQMREKKQTEHELVVMTAKNIIFHTKLLK